MSLTIYIHKYFVITLVISYIGEDCTANTPLSTSCCDNKPEKCGENEGDCDTDSHCKPGLTCGIDNCPSGFPSNYDCCYTASLGIVYNMHHGLPGYV